MAKVEKSKLRKSKVDDNLPLERENFLIIGAGLLVIVLGYLALSKMELTGFLPLTAAPILLVIGYCVIVPYGIMYRKKDKQPTTSAAPPTA